VIERAQKEILNKLLLQQKNKSRLWAALAALCIGTTLLLLSVMIWWNFQELLHGKNDKNDSLGSTFLTINKKVTDDNMGHPEMTVFSATEIEAMRSAPQVQDIGVLVTNRFPVYGTLNGTLGMSTDLFLEGVPDRFIDKKPAEWQWEPGNNEVPIIISADFLNLYNYSFALSRGLPQLSESSIKSLVLHMKVGEGSLQQEYQAHVVGFSDRISSVLVPQAFIDYGNKTFVSGTENPPSRLIIKAGDPSDGKFVQYLQEHNYSTNSEQLRWSKLRAIVEIVSAATGVLAVLLMGIGALVFILFIELTVAKAQQSLALLLQIGYSPKVLSRFMMSRFLPLVFITLVIAKLIAVAVQISISIWAAKMLLTLPMLPGWPVWGALIISGGLLFALVSNSIVKAIRNT
jgi:hypothetical protein